jgi:CRP-like cAMP-binding protein
MHSTMQTVMQPTATTRHPAIAHQERPAPRDALDLLEQFGATVTIKHNGEIVGQGDAAKFCYKILDGCVRRVNLMEDGRRQVCAFLMAGDLFGFDDLINHDFAAEAVSDVVLRRYPRRLVEALADGQLALALRLRDLTAASLRTAHSHLMLLGRKSASERIASFLLEMAERLPEHGECVVCLTMPRTDVADYLGLTFETVSRILAQFRHDGIIAIERGRIEIRNRISLEMTASAPRH